MNMHQRLAQPRTQPANLARLGSAWALVGRWLSTCARYYRAAALFEELSRLSDAELARRGLDRATLARELCEEREQRPHH